MALLSEDLTGAREAAAAVADAFDLHDPDELAGAVLVLTGRTARARARLEDVGANLDAIDAACGVWLRPSPMDRWPEVLPTVDAVEPPEAPLRPFDPGLEAHRANVHAIGLALGAWLALGVFEDREVAAEVAAILAAGGVLRVVPAGAPSLVPVAHASPAPSAGGAS